MHASPTWRLSFLFVLLLGSPARADRYTDRADALLQGPDLEQARYRLSSGEKRALGIALCDKGRCFSEQTVGDLLRSPAAWSEPGQRRLLGTLLRSLPAVADVKGVEETLALSAKHENAALRGHGTEIIAAAALCGYRSEIGERARVTRIGGMLRCADGRERESDGAALIGADGIQRLVTVKSISTPNAVSGAVTKATDQLALRNLQRNGARSPGVIMLGYDDPQVLAELQSKDWRAMATRTGAKLLVLAVNHHTGRALKLASCEPDPDSPVKPKALPPRISFGKRVERAVLGFIGRRSPAAATRVARWRSTLHKRWQSFRGSFGKPR